MGEGKEKSAMGTIADSGFLGTDIILFGRAPTARTIPSANSFCNSFISFSFGLLHEKNRRIDSHFSASTRFFVFHVSVRFDVKGSEFDFITPSTSTPPGVFRKKYVA